MDDNLTWNHHIQKTRYKIINNMYIISANRKTLPVEIRKTLYNSFIKPYMDYGIELWGGQGINQIEKFKKMCQIDHGK